MYICVYVGAWASAASPPVVLYIPDPMLYLRNINDVYNFIMTKK